MKSRYAVRAETRDGTLVDMAIIEATDRADARRYMAARIIEAGWLWVSVAALHIQVSRVGAA
jgi:hypothetical protein